ncbi:MAG: hypothetical protein H0X30_30825, partial [Anaerolineae bacterium]|nr:hypothetical protein [Anaerolineae bacterium]
GNNDLLASTNLAFSLDIIWRTVFHDLPDSDVIPDKLAGLPRERLSQLKTLISNYVTQIFDISMALDALDELADKSEWDKKAYSIYRHEGKEEMERSDNSPFDTLWVMISLVKIRSALLEISDNLTEAEMALVVNWVSWAVEEQHIVSEVQNLSSVLEQLRSNPLIKKV